MLERQGDGDGDREARQGRRHERVEQDARHEVQPDDVEEQAGGEEQRPEDHGHDGGLEQQKHVAAELEEDVGVGDVPAPGRDAALEEGQEQEGGHADPQQVHALGGHGEEHAVGRIEGPEPVGAEGREHEGEPSQKALEPPSPVLLGQPEGEGEDGQQGQGQGQKGPAPGYGVLPQQKPLQQGRQDHPKVTLAVDSVHGKME